jgi:PAS domain S-box-containing protein
MTDEILNPNRPNAIDKEVFWDKTLTIVSKSDLFGTIEYANEAFADVSGYEEYELVGKPHSLLRHPDMPQVLYKILWDNLKVGNPFQIIFKNLSKSGRYYWVISEFEYSKDATGNIENYISRRNAVSTEVLEGHIIPLYKKLLQIEEASGMKYSEKYMIGFLEEKGLSFSDYIFSLVNDGKTKSKVVFDKKDSEKILVSENSIVNDKKVIVPEIQNTVSVPETKVIQDEVKQEILQQVEPIEKIKEKIEDTELKTINNNTEITKVNKAEIKPIDNDLNEDNSSDYEEVERESRTGFIGKLFGRE